jgi:hypothetical protein
LPVFVPDGAGSSWGGEIAHLAEELLPVAEPGEVAGVLGG